MLTMFFGISVRNSLCKVHLTLFIQNIELCTISKSLQFANAYSPIVHLDVSG